MSVIYQDTNKTIYLDDPGEVDEETGEVISPRVERVVYADPDLHDRVEGWQNAQAGPLREIHQALADIYQRIL